MQLLQDEMYMRLALDMAKGAKGQTGVNPVVGCVLVKDGRIIGMGAHLHRGQGHAEVHALQMAGAEAEGSTAYVTLEPCSHFGKMPPCSGRLIDHGVKRVVIAAVDPNPQVAGAGIERLRSAGIEVDVGLLAEEASAMNEAFNKYIVTGMPFVTMKTASTLDGKIAAKTGDSKWITGDLSRAYVHTMRHQHQGILVSVDTVIADDPQLSTRLTVPALQPVRIVADSRLRLPLEAQVLQDLDRQPTIVLTTELSSPERRRALEELSASVLTCGSGPQVDLRLAMKQLGEREIGSILLEGGGRLNGAMLEQGLVDKIMLFVAPKIIGGKLSPQAISMEGWERMKDALRLERFQAEPVGEDICLSGYPVYTADAEKIRKGD